MSRRYAPFIICFKIIQKLENFVSNVLLLKVQILYQLNCINGNWILVFPYLFDQWNHIRFLSNPAIMLVNQDKFKMYKYTVQIKCMMYWNPQTLILGEVESICRSFSHCSCLFWHFVTQNIDITKSDSSLHI